MSSSITLATSAQDLDLTGLANTHFVNRSVTVHTCLCPASVAGNGPMRSIAGLMDGYAKKYVHKYTFPSH